MLTFNEMSVIYNALETQGDETVCTFVNGDKIVIADLKAKVKKIGTASPVTFKVNVNAKDIAHVTDALNEIEKENKRRKESVKSPEEAVREYYEKLPSYKEITDSVAYIDGQEYAVVRTLNLLGIKIEGVNA